MIAFVAQSVSTLAPQPAWNPVSLTISIPAVILAIVSIFFGRQINEWAVWLIGYFRKRQFSGVYKTEWQHHDENTGLEKSTTDFLCLRQRGPRIKGTVFYTSDVSKDYTLEGHVEPKAVHGEWLNKARDYRGFFLWRNSSYKNIDGAWVGPDRHGNMQAGTWHLVRVATPEEAAGAENHYFDKDKQKKALTALVEAHEKRPRGASEVNGLKLNLLDGMFDPKLGKVSLEVLEVVKSEAPATMLDVGTGCGLYALYFGKKGVPAVGVDVSGAAVHCAQSNAILNQVTTAKFFRSDLFNDLAVANYDLICANLPFTKPELCKPIRDSKYALSFACSPDLLKRFIFQLRDYLSPAGSVVFAFGSSGDLALLHLCCRLAGFQITAERVSELKDAGETFFVFRLRKL